MASNPDLTFGTGLRPIRSASSMQSSIPPIFTTFVPRFKLPGLTFCNTLTKRSLYCEAKDCPVDCWKDNRQRLVSPQPSYASYHSLGICRGYWRHLRTTDSLCIEGTVLQAASFGRGILRCEGWFRSVIFSNSIDHTAIQVSYQVCVLGHSYRPPVVSIMHPGLRRSFRTWIQRVQSIVRKDLNSVSIINIQIRGLVKDML